MDERKLELRVLEPRAATSFLEEMAGAARTKGFSSMAVFSSRVMEVSHWLEDSNVKVCAAVGLPWGESDPDAKRYEVEAACDNGAQQIEYTPFLPPFLKGDHKRFLRELNDAVEAAEERPFFLHFDPRWIDQSLLPFLRNLSEEAKVTGWALPFPGETDALQALPSGVEIKLLVESIDQIRQSAAAGIKHFSLPCRLAAKIQAEIA